MAFIILQDPLLGGIILRDNTRALHQCCCFMIFYEKTVDLLILDDITRSLRQSSERIPVDGGTVSDPLSIKATLT